MQKDERVKALHYSTHAIEQLEAGIRTVRKDMPGILHAHQVMVKLLRESVKFILPNCAELVDMGEIRQAHLDLARLPFPARGVPEGPTHEMDKPTALASQASTPPAIADKALNASLPNGRLK